MPYHLPTSASLNTVAAAALSWAKKAASKRSSKTTLTQQLQDNIIDLARVADNSMSPQMEITPDFNDHMATLPFPHPPLSPLSYSECSSSKDGSSDSIHNFTTSESDLSTLSSSVESSPSPRVHKSRVSVPQDDYFFLYLAPRPRTPIFAPCQSSFMSSVFEDDSDEDEPAPRKVSKKLLIKKIKRESKRTSTHRL